MLTVRGLLDLKINALFFLRVANKQIHKQTNNYKKSELLGPMVGTFKPSFFALVFPHDFPHSSVQKPPETEHFLAPEAQFLSKTNLANAQKRKKMVRSPCLMSMSAYVFNIWKVRTLKKQRNQVKDRHHRHHRVLIPIFVQDYMYISYRYRKVLCMMYLHVQVL